MKTALRSESGFTLLESLFSLGILTVGALGMIGVFLQGMTAVSSSPGDLTATQKAAGAIESVFSARDAHTLTWAQLRNSAYGGIFLNGPRPLKTAGPDGIVNTSDDGEIEQVVLPGRDQVLGTRDDKTQTLSEYTREVRIQDLTDSLRSVTVIITYKIGVATREYTLTAYISQFA
jgi:hypothetical protein